MAIGNETDVVIHVQSSSFHLHKDPLASKCGYLKRQLGQMSEITLSPPLNITAATFALVADFCYGTHLVITPFNVAALRTAAELLEMTETNGACQENLRQKTETYFRRAVAVNREYALIVFRSCLSLLPEAEKTAFLVSRCIEALSLMDDGDGVMTCIDDVTKVGAEDFQLIAESMSRLLTESHDLVYKIVDVYLKEYTDKITDDQKTRICNYIDCTILSPQLLMHAVQNPRMPLRFVVQAMFVEQLNTRRSIFSAADHHNHVRKHQSKNAATLGAIIQRDAALRQVAQLKSAMDATSSRIQTLETELSGMRKLLTDSENHRNSVLDSGRSASFRLSSEKMVEREQRGSASFRIVSRRVGAGGSSSSEGSGDGSPRIEKGFRRRLMSGLKSALRVSSSASKKKSESKVDGDGDDSGKRDVIVIKKDKPFHR
ncbi:unnamed protein product [Ilex paraguariensis]|uniref:Phototropic-responsive NPH3 family protein n=1 Tax=Ilex paraguariensis TaxID=185542 RepID=A0ABC8RMH3_9AQUA